MSFLFCTVFSWIFQKNILSCYFLNKCPNLRRNDVGALHEFSTRFSIQVEISWWMIHPLSTWDIKALQSQNFSPFQPFMGLQSPQPTSWKSRKRTTQLNLAFSEVNSVWKKRNIFIQQRKLVVSLALEAAAAAFLKLSLFSTTGNKQLGAPTTRTPSAATSQQVETVQ